MRFKTYSAYELARIAECGAPDTLESAGAAFLVSVRDAVAEAIEWPTITLEEGDDNSSTVHEIADGAPDVYTHTRWVEFVDLGAYREEPEAGEWPKDLFDMAGVALYQIAYRLATALIADAREEFAEAEAASEADQS